LIKFSRNEYQRKPAATTFPPIQFPSLRQEDPQMKRSSDVHSVLPVYKCSSASSQFLGDGPFKSVTKTFARTDASFVAAGIFASGSRHGNANIQIRLPFCISSDHCAPRMIFSGPLPKMTRICASAPSHENTIFSDAYRVKSNGGRARRRALISATDRHRSPWPPRRPPQGNARDPRHPLTHHKRR